MARITDVFQSGDWKNEKHVPVIDAPDIVSPNYSIDVAVTVGKEIAHPNTTEHHIAWMELYFWEDGAKSPVNLGRFEFGAHGASVQGPNTSTVFTEPKVLISFKTQVAGTLMATSYCNIHGLWESSKALRVS